MGLIAGLIASVAGFCFNFEHPVRARGGTAVSGAWAGGIDFSGLSIRMRMPCTPGAGGSAAALDTPQQGARNPLQWRVTLDAAAIRFELLTAGPGRTPPHGLPPCVAATGVGGVTDSRIDAAATNASPPWWTLLWTFHPATALAKVACPVLAIFSGPDRQVPSLLHHDAVEKARSMAGRR